MAVKKAPVAVPPALRKKLEILDAARMGAPRDIYYSMLEMELDAECGGAASAGAGKRRSTLSEYATGARPRMTEMRRKYNEIRKGMLSRPALVPTPVSFGSPHLPGGHAAPVEFDYSASQLSVVGGQLSGDPCGEAVSNDFTLKLSHCISSTEWNVLDLLEVHCGIVGWCTTHSRQPVISNLNGKGTTHGSLELVWSGTVPGDDVYIMRPTIPLLVFGECFADGYAKPGVDATADAELTTHITVGDRILTESALQLASVESRLLATSEYFGEYLILHSCDLAFYATKGQEVRILVRLHGDTWTRGRADAEVLVEKFGVISNVMADTDIPVRS